MGEGSQGRKEAIRLFRMEYFKGKVQPLVERLRITKKYVPLGGRKKEKEE